MTDAQVGGISEAQSDALQVLLASSALLLTSSDQYEVLAGILDIASRVLSADAYAVWCEMDDHGTWRAIATKGLSEQYRREIHSVTEARVPVTSWPVEDIRQEPSLAQFQSVYAQERIHSLLVVPLSREDGRAGTITFYWRQRHRSTSLDMAYAGALANLSAAAINQRWLQEKSRRERDRLAFLAEASAALASSLDYEATLQKVAQLAVPGVADWCVIHVAEGGTPTRIVTAHADPSMDESAAEYQRRFPEEIRDDRGVGAVLRTGVTEFHPRITDEQLQAAARSPEHFKAIQAWRIRSSILAPLTSHGKVLGTIRFLATGDRPYFDQDDVRLAEDLASRAAIAIENAQLHREVLRKESELRLSHSAARMGSWNWDLVKKTILWSNEFKLVHELPPDAEPAFETGHSLIHPDDRERVMTELQSVLASEADLLQIEHRAITPAGRTMWVQSRGSIFRDAAGAAVAISGITIDITDWRLAEEALRRSEKLAAAGRLAATVAHEVNNPLEALTNLVYLVQTMQGLPAEARELLATADGELRRMAQVVRQTLGFYRESEQAGPTDIGNAARQMASLYGNRASNRGVELSCTSEEGCVVTANVGEMKQVIANLVANAIDASRGWVRISVDRVGDQVRLQVADNGAGVAAEHRARLFEPFFTTKDEVGTGLGLWVSKGIVEKAGGSIDFDTSTEPDHSGTTVTVLLPA